MQKNFIWSFQHFSSIEPKDLARITIKLISRRRVCKTTYIKPLQVPFLLLNNLWFSSFPLYKKKSHFFFINMLVFFIKIFNEEEQKFIKDIVMQRSLTLSQQGHLYKQCTNHQSLSFKLCCIFLQGIISSLSHLVLPPFFFFIPHRKHS